MEVRITFLATAGVVLEYGGTRIMVDGLIDGNGHPFSTVPQPLKDDLLFGFEPLGTIDYLLFTHLHPDHFDSEQAITYLKNNTVKSVLLPVEESKEKLRQKGARLQHWMQAHHVPFMLPELPVGNHGRYALDGGISVTAFNTGHMGEHYASVSNYCLLLHLGGKTLLFTGDADFHEDGFALALSGQQVDAVFINPLFYQSPAGRDILDRIIRPRQVVLYHIPFQEDDTLMLRPMVRWQTKRYANDRYTVIALTEPGQELVL